MEQVNKNKLVTQVKKKKKHLQDYITQDQTKDG